MPVPQTKVFLSASLAAGRALRFTPNAAGDFGATVTTAAVASWLSAVVDLNGEGRPDFIFGTPGDDDKAIDAGRIVVSLDAFAGGGTNVVNAGVNRMIIDGVNAGDHAGAAVGSVADLNGDGKAEILVGAPGMENGTLIDAGAAFVIWGAAGVVGVDPNDPFTANGGGSAIKGEAAGDAAGTTIMSIGDLNGEARPTSWSARPAMTPAAAMPARPMSCSAGADTMIGGLGNDNYKVDDVGDVVTEAPSAGTDTVTSTIDYVLGANLENLVLGGAARIGTGNDLANAITGTIGNDALDGGAGVDTLTGGLGDDVYLVDNPGDVVIEAAGEGFDTVVVNSDWTLADNIEDVTLVGTGHTLTGNAANNTLTGDAGNDTLDGGAGDNTEIGGNGKDRLVSASGHDTLAGGSGNDVYVLKGGSAHIEDFQGHDTVDASHATGDSHIDLSGDTQTLVENQVCDFGTGGTITGALNVRFLQDLTGSFADDITTVRSLVPQIVTALQSVQANSAFGVSTFRDKATGTFGGAGDWVYLTQNSIGSTPAALAAAYSSMIASGGNDLPEAQLEALMQIGLRASSEVGFQSNAARFVVLFTMPAFILPAKASRRASRWPITATPFWMAAA